MLPLIVILAIIAVIILIAGSVVLWLTGLFVAFLFFIIGVMLLYALHEMDVLDVQQDRWLLIFPAVMFFIGLGLDKVGVLTFLPYQPLSLSTLMPFTLTFQNVMLVAILALLIIDVVASFRSVK